MLNFSNSVEEESPHGLDISPTHYSLKEKDRGYQRLLSGTSFARLSNITPEMEAYIKEMADTAGYSYPFHLMSIDAAGINPFFGESKSLRPNTKTDFIIAGFCDEGLLLMGTIAAEIIDWADIVYALDLNTDRGLILQTVAGDQLSVEDINFQHMFFNLVHPGISRARKATLPVFRYDAPSWARGE